MTVLELKIKLEELIAKGVAEYKVYTFEELQDEDGEGNLYSYTSECEAKSIEINSNEYYIKIT